MKITQPINAEEAREQAIEWQHWIGEQALSFDEILGWQNHFESVAEQYDLVDEFKENGVI